MIINDFELIFFLKKNIKIVILLDDSLRSFIILKIIKNFIKKKHFFVDSESLDYNKYNNMILIFKENFHYFLNNKLIDKFLINNNIIIFVLNNFSDKSFINKINYFFKDNIITIVFKNLNYEENFLWIKQFFIYKSYYFNDKIFNYLNKIFFNKIEILIINFEFSNYKKSLLQLLLNIKFDIDYNLFLKNLDKKKINISLYTYKNTNDYIKLFEKYNEFNIKDNFIIYLFIIFDINEKNNTKLNSEIILFNFIINNFFEEKIRKNDFDKFNIKYITKK